MLAPGASSQSRRGEQAGDPHTPRTGSEGEKTAFVHSRYSSNNTCFLPASPRPKDRETTAHCRDPGLGSRASGTGERSKPTLGVEEEALQAGPALHSALVPELPVSMQEASTTQALERILEIRRFAGVDINSPKLPAQLLSQRCGPGGQGDSLSRVQTRLRGAAAPQPSLPFGPRAPPRPRCLSRFLSPNANCFRTKAESSAGCWFAVEGLKGQGARMGRNTWGAGGHRAVKTTLSSVTPGQGQPCFHPIPITNLIRLDMRLQIRHRQH